MKYVCISLNNKCLHAKTLMLATDVSRVQTVSETGAVQFFTKRTVVDFYVLMWRPHALSTHTHTVMSWRDSFKCSGTGGCAQNAAARVYFFFYCHSNNLVCSIFSDSEIRYCVWMNERLTFLITLAFYAYPVLSSVTDAARVPFLICQMHSFSRFLNIDLLKLQWLLFTSLLCTDKICSIGRRSYGMGWNSWGLELQSGPNHTDFTSRWSFRTRLEQ